MCNVAQIKNKVTNKFILFFVAVLVCVYATLSFADDIMTDNKIDIDSAQNALVQPSFDCSQAVSAIEQAICASPELSALDQKLAKSFYLLQLFLVEMQKKVLHEQREWLKQRISKCLQLSGVLDEKCLLKMYQERNEQIMRLQVKYSDKIT